MLAICSYLLFLGLALSGITKFSLYIGARVQYFEVVLLTAIVVWVIAFGSRRRNLKSVEKVLLLLPWPGVFLGALSLVSVLAAGLPGEGLLQYLKALLLMNVGASIYTFSGLFGLQLGDKGIQAALRAMIVGLAISGLYGLISIYLWISSSIDLDALVAAALPFFPIDTATADQAWGGSVRLTGFTNDPSVYAAFATSIIIYLLDRFFNDLSFRSFIVVAFFISTLLLTISGSGIAGFGVGFFLLLVCRVSSVATKPEEFISLLKGVLPLVVFIGGVFFPFADEINRLVEVKLARDGTIAVHAEIAKNAYSLFEERVFFGFGLNNFSVAYEAVFGVAGYNAHNSWLNSMVEFGFFGPVLMLLILSVKVMLVLKYCINRPMLISILAANTVTSFGYETYNFMFLQVFWLLVFLENMKARRLKSFYQPVQLS